MAICRYTSVVSAFPTDYAGTAEYTPGLIGRPFDSLILCSYVDELAARSQHSRGGLQEFRLERSSTWKMDQSQVARALRELRVIPVDVCLWRRQAALVEARKQRQAFREAIRPVRDRCS